MLVQPYQLSHWFHKEPLLDWLDLYGEQNGFVPDHKREGYNPETDFSVFIRAKSSQFKRAVLRCLINQGFDCVDPSKTDSLFAEEESIAKTIEAIQAGREVIFRGRLVDHERSTLSTPDFLVRADVLSRIAGTPANTGSGYVVVGARYGTIELNAKGTGVNGGAGTEHKKAKLLIESRALAHIQGFLPQTSYLLGRSWKQGQDRGHSCFERLGPVDLTDPSIGAEIDAAMDWLDLVTREGAGWRLLPEPTHYRLRANPGNRSDSPWHFAKGEIAEAMQDPVLLWRVGPEKRDAAVANGIVTFNQPNATPRDFGVSGATYEPILQAFLDTMRDTSDRNVFPERIQSERDVWGQAAGVEFYVDFETVTNADDDFEKMPEAGGQPLIFMIGCGHMEAGEWKFECFIADELTESCEAEAIDAWLSHMEAVRMRLAPELERPLCFHWSPAEDSSFLRQYNSACNRQPEKNWPSPNWYDFLKRVVQAEPVMVKGARSFGLKDLARAMKRNGLIQTNWTDGPGDGLAAMVGAWTCNQRAAKDRVPMSKYPLMESIRDYNEVDCKVMQEIVAYLRQHH